MPSALSTYGFVSAKLKTRLSKALSAETVDRLIRAPSLPEAMPLLRGTRYAPIETAYSETGDLLAGEALIRDAEIRLYTELFKYFDGPLLEFVKALALRYEVDQAKHAVRLWFDARVRGRDIDGKSGYLRREPIVNRLDLDAIVRAPDAAALAAAFGGTPYASLAAEILPTVIESKSLFRFETALDKAYFRLAFQAASRLPGGDRRIAERALGVEADLLNLSWMARIQGPGGLKADAALEAMIPGGRAVGRSEIDSALASGAGAGDSGLALLKSAYRGAASIGASGSQASRLAFLEGALRQVGSSEASRSLAGNPFSIGVVLAYFSRSRDEFRAVRAILHAKHYGLFEDKLRSAL